jgi:hypothetical protein
MSEKIFALLLRLYPACFRARYGEESLQLLRDRLRDETGILARVRLVFDLLTDTAIALPRAHRLPIPAISAASAGSLNGLPSFSVLEPQSLRPAALVLASIIGITSAATFAVVLQYAGINHASRLAIVEQHAAAERRWTNGGFLGRPLPPPPPPPSYDMLETPMDPPPPSVSPHPASTSTSPANSTRSAPAARPAAIPGPSANNLQSGPARELTPIILVPVLGPETQTGPAIPLPALEKQLGIVPETTDRGPASRSPSRPTPVQPYANTGKRRSIVVLNPTTEPPPCPATTSETGSNSSINPASSAASARKSLPCSKSPKSPTASASPASAAAPK